MNKYVTIEMDKINDMITIHHHTKKQFRKDDHSESIWDKSYLVFLAEWVTFKFRSHYNAKIELFLQTIQSLWDMFSFNIPFTLSRLFWKDNEKSRS